MLHNNYINDQQLVKTTMYYFLRNQDKMLQFSFSLFTVQTTNPSYTRSLTHIHACTHSQRRTHHSVLSGPRAPAFFLLCSIPQAHFCPGVCNPCPDCFFLGSLLGSLHARVLKEGRGQGSLNDLSRK